jgi:hypothetical protein
MPCWCLSRAKGEQCELCYHSPNIPGSRDHKAVKWMHGGPDNWNNPSKEVEVEVELEDEESVA